MATTTIERMDGTRVKATYVRHLRTLSGNKSMGDRSMDVDLYRLADGTTIQCISPEIDARVTPVEVDPTRGNYPGFPPGA